MTTRPCPICDSKDADALRRFDFVLPDDYPLPDHYAVVACNRCGMVYADTEATQANYDQFYRDFNKYATRYEGRVEYLWASSAERIKKHVRYDARILDVGCANGELLTILARRGYTRLTGIDPSAECAARGISIMVGTLSNLPAGLGVFDCVILTHVLEHVCDVYGAMKTVKRLLKPQGIVYVEVPDAGNQYSTQYNGPYQEINTEHINCFSEQCLRNLASVHSMKTISAGTAISDRFPITYLVADASSPVPMKRDNELRRKISAYLDESEQMMQAYQENLRADLGAARSVIVWGAGELAMKMLRLPPLCEVKIKTIVDGNPAKTGRKMGSVSVVGPDALKSSTTPIVITSVIHADSIKCAIEKAGLTNPVVELRL